MNIFWLFCITNTHLHVKPIRHNKLTGEFKASCDDCGKSYLQMNGRSVAVWSEALENRANNEGWFYL